MVVVRVVPCKVRVAAAAGAAISLCDTAAAALAALPSGPNARRRCSAGMQLRWVSTAACRRRRQVAEPINRRRATRG